MVEWRDVVGYEGLYKVNNKGDVKSVDRYIFRRGTYNLIKGHKLAKTPFRNGYIKAVLCKNGKVKQALVHRLVAEAFIENPLNLPQINHKDENVKNNCVENLEWCTSKYNANYGTRNKRQSQKVSKPVNQYDLDGNLIKKWDQVRSVVSGGYDTKSVITACKTKGKIYKKSLWEYAKKSEVNE